MFCYFRTGIFEFFWLTTKSRHGHNLVLLKLTIKQLEIVYMNLVWHRIDTRMTSRRSVSRSPRWRLKSKKKPGSRDQYPRDIEKPAGMKNDVNSMRSVERIKKPSVSQVIQNIFKELMILLRYQPLSLSS